MAALAGLLLPLALHANDKSVDLDQVRAEQQQIRAGIAAATGPYAGMPASRRAELVRKQDALLRLIEGKSDARELTAAERTEAFNAVEWIQAAITENDDDRMVCTRERTVGSNRIQSVCRTQAQARQAREAARERMLKRGACTELGGPSCRSD